MRKFAFGLAAITAATLYAGVASAQIKVALNGPITGQLASFGEQMKRGAEMAIADLNAKGGVNGQKLTLVIGDDQQGIIAAGYIADKFKGKKVAIIHDKTAYGQGLADETRKALAAKGMKETMYEAITAGEKDYSALISKMKQAGIELIYLGGYHPEAGLIVRQAKEAGLNAPLMGGDALVDKQFWAIAGDAGAGTLMTFSPDPRKNAAAKPVVDKFKAGGYDPEGYTLYTYAAIQAWAQAATTAKSVKTADVTKALHSGTFDTVMNKFSFDKKGDVTAPGYVVYVWQGGSYDYVK